MKSNRKNYLIFTVATIIVVVCFVFRNSILSQLDLILQKDVAVSSTTGTMLFIMVLIGIECIAACFTVLKKLSQKSFVKKGIAAYVMIILLMLNYNFDIFSRSNAMFKGFQADSETLVAASIIAEKLNLDEKYNLGAYRNILNNGHMELRGAAFYEYVFTPYSGGEITDGYSTKTNGVAAVCKGDNSRDVFLPGRTIEFADGTVCRVEYLEDKEDCIYLHTDYDGLFTTQINGNLIDIKVYDENGESVSLHEYTRYYSQYGLQGQVFRFGAKFLPVNLAFAMYYLICTLILSVCFTAITMLLAQKYNKIMAASFYLVFWLAPTVINYARNLYWVEFTWFVPVVFGLFCAAYFKNKTARLISCAGVYISVLIKCLCGYKYISAILVATMMFLFADFVKVCVQKDKQQAIMYFKVMAVMGTAGLAGFATAVLIHASSLGMADISEALNYIWNFVVIKRTSGINNPFSAISGAEVVKTYMSFDLDIISGIYGTHFKKMMLLPTIVVAAELVCFKKADFEKITLYLLGFVAAASWFLIAKEHSMVHFYMNIVLWYFGFVQMCIYIPLKFIVDRLLRSNR